MNASQVDPGAIFVVILVLALVGGAIWRLVQYYRERSQPGFADPHELFRELCAAHQLDAKAVSLLTELADLQQADPALLFVEPERLSRDHTGPQFAKRQVELLTLRAKLFATDAA